MRYRFIPAALMLILAAAHPAAAATNLVKNNSFEQPVVKKGTTLTVNVGDTIGPWVVVGSAIGNTGVYVINKNYVEEGGAAHFTPELGSQFIDLSGPGNEGPIGVQQNITTAIGATYQLTFYIGNEDDALPSYGAPSAATVFINGVNAGTFTCDVDVPGNTGWQQFTVSFTAAKANTAITFINAGADALSGLDNVSVVQTGAPAR